jgi:hypothetical protein
VEHEQYLRVILADGVNCGHVVVEARADHGSFERAEDAAEHGPASREARQNLGRTTQQSRGCAEAQRCAGWGANFDAAHDAIHFLAQRDVRQVVAPRRKHHVPRPVSMDVLLGEALQRTFGVVHSPKYREDQLGLIVRLDFHTAPAPL